MNFNIKSQLLVLILLLSLVSCSRNYTLTSNEKKIYKMDSAYSPDSKVVSIIAPYKIKIDAQMNEIIGFSETEMQKAEPESKLGNFVADATLVEIKLSEPQADFSFYNNGGLRSLLPKGNITVGSVFELMPFENELVLLEIKSDSIISLVNYLIKRNGAPVGGIRLKANAGIAQEILINDKPFDKSRNYFVLTSDFLAGGGDNYIFFANPVSRKNLNLKLRNVLIAHIRSQTKSSKKLNPILDGRIKITK